VEREASCISLSLDVRLAEVVDAFNRKTVSLDNAAEEGPGGSGCSSSRSPLRHGAEQRLRIRVTDAEVVTGTAGGDLDLG
jgi:hypothetical protein